MLLKSDIDNQIDWERRENNVAFANPAQITSLENRALQTILREPGIRTVLKTTTITVNAGTDTYNLPADFKEVIQLISGVGGSNPIPFLYKLPDEYNLIISGFCYTFLERGKIRIKFPDINTLPTANITLDYWSRYVVLDQDGITAKEVWVNDNDTSLLEDEFDEFYIMWPTSRILRREGKTEWKDYDADAMKVMENMKEAPGSKTQRPRRNFGHYMGGAN